jgi:Leucine-rich repeat (LRR) protein
MLRTTYCSMKLVEYFEWVKNGCPVVDSEIGELNLLHSHITNLTPLITNLPNLQVIDIRDNHLTSLPIEIGSLTYLKTLSIGRNWITELPVEIGNLKSLVLLDVSINHLKTLPNSIGNLPSLANLDLSCNQFTTFPLVICDLVNLEVLRLTQNQLTTIPPEIGKLRRLQNICISRNQITSLPVEIVNMRRLLFIFASENRLSTIPAEIGTMHICYMSIVGNPIEYLPPNVQRIIENNMHEQGIYGDSQSVHNSSVQKTIKASIMRILSIRPSLSSDDVLANILSDSTLNAFTKQSLVEYSRNADLISEVNVSFLDVLTAVWNRIISNENADDIKQILNSEMSDAECKCFTGRVSRLVNCLAGVDELVEVKIADNEQIGNVIAVVRNTLNREGRYTVELHKKIVLTELKELGYTDEVVTTWINYIE